MRKTSKSSEQKVYAWSTARDWPAVKKYLDTLPIRAVALHPPERASVVWAFVSNGSIPDSARVELLNLIAQGKPVMWFALSKDKTKIHPLVHCGSDYIPDRVDLMQPEAFADAVGNKFAAMAKKLLAGASYAELEEGLDELLGTELGTRDATVEAEWEISYREGQQ